MRYNLLKYKIKSADRERVIDRLMALQTQLDRDVPSKDADNNLLLATWNVRDFGKTNRRGYGKRLPETHFYIAEILSRFDFVAVQEVNELPEWETVMSILGPSYDFIATDVTDTKLGGNGERLTYVFDRRKVFFQNIAGEIVLPVDMLISKVEVEHGEKRIVAGKQFRRTPFVASFQSNWFRFDICTVHLYYGAASGTKLQERVEEIGTIAKYLGKRADAALKAGKALILLGDFNIVHPEHKTMKALTDQGFVVPKTLQRPSNLDLTKYYDQIAFKTKEEVIQYVEKKSIDPLKRNAGIFELFENLFTEEMFDDYKAAAKATSNGKKTTTTAELKAYYFDWRTYQISDHKPMWVRLDSNSADEYLTNLKSA